MIALVGTCPTFDMITPLPLTNNPMYGFGGMLGKKHKEETKLIMRKNQMGIRIKNKFFEY